MSGNVVDPTKISIRPIEKSVAKKLIVENHYSHKWTSCRFALGVFYQESESHSWFTETDKLVGCIIYGYPVGRQTSDSISPLIKKGEVLELTRLWIDDDYGKNTESYVIGQSFRWLKSNSSDTKVLISYSDPEQGHSGTIYQATNWLYQGNKTMRMDAHSFKLEKSGPWLHQRAINAKYERVGLKSLTTKIKTPFWRKQDMHKHRYIYLLCSKSERKQILKTLKHPAIPYPPPTEKCIPKIEQIDLINGEIVITEVENI